MSVTDAVLAAVESLSPAQQQEVLAFAQALKQSSEATEVSNRWLESPFVGIWKICKIALNGCDRCGSSTGTVHDGSDTGGY
jgi:hypothetical protein